MLLVCEIVLTTPNSCSGQAALYVGMICRDFALELLVRTAWPDRASFIPTRAFREGISLERGGVNAES